MVVPQKDVITRVAYMVKMYRRTILNHYAFQKFFGDESRCGKPAAEKLAFTCFRDVSPKDWNLIIKVEAVLNSCAQYALGVTQKDATITFPFTLYFRSLLQRCFDTSSFQCLMIGSKPEHDATEFSQVRVTKLKADFSEEGRVCIDR